MSNVLILTERKIQNENLEIEIPSSAIPDCSTVDARGNEAIGP